MIDRIIGLYQDKLLQNSLYLILNYGAMAGFGFFFWLACSHLFTPEEVGIATTLISAMTLITYISLLGFNYTFIYTLPNSVNRDREINSGLTLSLFMAIFVATLYVVFVPYLAPDLRLINENIFYAILFVLMVTTASLNLLIDSVYVAYRAAKYNFFIDGIIMSAVKLALPFALLGLGAFGIFSSAGGATVVAFLLSIYFLARNFNYSPRFYIHFPTIKKLFTYSFSNYISHILNIAPTLVLPLIVIDYQGAAAAGYFYVAFMIATLLYAVSYSVCQALFAEGSYAEEEFSLLIKKTLAVFAALLIPGTIVLYFLANFGLSIFGATYANEATNLLQIFGLASIPVALFTLTTVLLRINEQIKGLIFINIVYFISISGLAYHWGDLDLEWIGYAWLIGNTLSFLIGVLFIYFNTNKKISA